MAFILTDLANKDHDLQIANRSWRPIVEEIRRRGIVADDRAETIAFHLCTEVTAPEAASISEHFSALLQLRRLPAGINPEIAKRVSTFAASSSGFEVC